MHSAKPASLPPYLPLDAQASSSSLLPSAVQNPVRRPRRRTRRTALPPRSPAVLVGAFATVVAASARASPLTASQDSALTLCPFIDEDGSVAYISIDSEDSCPFHHPDLTPIKLLPAGLSPRQAPTPTRRGNRPRDVPDRYQKGDDGRWRLVPGWQSMDPSDCTAYCSASSSVATSSISVADDSVDPTLDASAKLPRGWTTGRAESPSQRTLLITAVSLALACFIVAFMVGLVFMRAKHKKASQRDVEKFQMRVKKRLHGGDGSDDETIDLHRARAAQKLWVKASARWRANVRASMRRRRATRQASSVKSLPPSIASSLFEVPRSRPRTAPSSRVSSRRNSLAMAPDASAFALPADSTALSFTRPHSPSTPEPVSSSVPSASASTPTPSLDPVDIPPPPGDPPLPPAYGPAPSQRASGKRRTLESEPSYTATSSSPLHAEGEADTNHEPVSVHVATDDKAVLARIAEMASAPPPDGAAVPGTSHAPHGVSVPEWHDEELEDFPEGDARSSPLPTFASHASVGSGLSFPPPPSKGKLAAPAFYDYPASFEEDVLQAEPSMGPAAPPFDEASAPSAPPLELEDVDVPSAPPLDDPHDGHDGAVRHEAPASASGLVPARAANVSNGFEDVGAGAGATETDALPLYRT